MPDSEIHGGQIIRAFLKSPHIGNQGIDVTGIAEGAAGPQGPPGPAGLDGRTVRNGASNPTNDIGNNGDFYINTTAWTIFGPKAAGAWGTGSSLIGPQGPQGPAGGGGGGGGGPTESWLSGAADPANNVGADGDWYLNTTTGKILEKVAGAWVQRIASIIGPAGPQGPAGGGGGGGGTTLATIYPYLFPVALAARDAILNTSNTLVQTYVAPYDVTLEEIICTVETAASTGGLYAAEFDVRVGGSSILNGGIAIQLPLGQTRVNRVGNFTGAAATVTIPKNSLIQFYVGGVAATRGPQIQLLGTYALATTAPVTPGTPGAPTITRTSGQFAVAWTAATNATSYRVEISTDGGTSWSTFSTVSATNTTMTSLVTGTSYRIRVVAINGSTAGPPGAGSAATVFATVPSAPSLGGISTASQSVLTSILASSNTGGVAVTGYRILGRPFNSGSYQATNITGVAAGAVTITTLNGSALANNTAYEFVAVATNALGDSAQSASTGSVTPTAGGSVPSVPGTLNINEGVIANGACTMFWFGGTGAVTFDIRYKRVSVNEIWSEITGIPAAQQSNYVFNRPGLAVTDYMFQVRAANPTGASAWNDEVSYSSTNTSPPGQPFSLTATPTNGQVALSWSAPSGSPIDYEIQYRNTAQAVVEWTVFTDGTSVATNATVTGLTNGATYNFRVLARNSSCIGPPSSPPVSAVPSGAGFTARSIAPSTTNIGSIAHDAGPGSTLANLRDGAPNSQTAVGPFFAEPGLYVQAQLNGVFEDQPTYVQSQFFLEFDTGVGGTVQASPAPALKLWLQADQSQADFLADVFVFDYGTLADNDFRTVTQFLAIRDAQKIGEFNSFGIGATGALKTMTVTNAVAFRNAINTANGSKFRIVVGHRVVTETTGGLVLDQNSALRFTAADSRLEFSS